MYTKFISFYLVPYNFSLIHLLYSHSNYAFLSFVIFSLSLPPLFTTPPLFHFYLVLLSLSYTHVPTHTYAYISVSRLYLQISLYVNTTCFVHLVLYTHTYIFMTDCFCLGKIDYSSFRSHQLLVVTTSSQGGAL